MQALLLSGMEFKARPSTRVVNYGGDAQFSARRERRPKTQWRSPREPVVGSFRHWALERVIENTSQEEKKILLKILSGVRTVRDGIIAIPLGLFMNGQLSGTAKPLPANASPPSASQIAEAIGWEYGFMGICILYAFLGLRVLGGLFRLIDKKL